MTMPKNYRQLATETVKYLAGKNHVLFLTTSSRWSGEKGGEQPKSTRLAHHLAALVEKITGKKTVEIIDIPALKIYPCEGNVSTARGNTCGVRDALLTDKSKNPSGHHRCWASLHNPDDELWQVSKSLLESDCVLFFGSVRWGQMCVHYQKLIERLTWLENRHSTLGESNLLSEIEAGIIATGHNWNEEEVIATQREVLDYFGFKVVEALCWFWRYTDDPADESPQSYTNAAAEFEKTFFTEK
jgi:multimeric flavodoxin WrbA